MTSFAALSRAMMRGFLRDKMTVFWAILFPLMFLVLFGGIFTDRGATKSEVLQVGAVSVLDRLPPEAAEPIAETLDISTTDDRDDALTLLRAGDVDAVIEETNGLLTVHYSNSDQVAAARIMGTFGGIVDGANLAIAGAQPALTVEFTGVEDDSLEAIQYVTPSLLGWAVAMSATFGAAANLVVWRRNGLLRRLQLAPISTGQIVLARVGVAIIVAIVQAAVFLVIGVGAFSLKLSDQWPLIIPLLLAGTLSFLAIGLLAGAVSRTEEGAVGLANFIVLPMAFLSGTFFQLEGAPSWLQGISKALPLRHLNEGMLDVMVRGQGVEAIWLPMAILLVFTAVVSLISVKLFRWDA